MRLFHEHSKCMSSTEMIAFLRYLGYAGLSARIRSNCLLFGAVSFGT